MNTLIATEDTQPLEPAPTKVFKFSGRAIYLFAAGCILDVLSTFFPWSETAGGHWFLPFSVPMPLGWRVQFITETLAVLVVSLATRLGAILGLAGLLLLTYYKNRTFSTIILLMSTGLSFASAAIFFQIGWPFYIGAYMTLAGAFSKLLSLILENLEVQIIAEEESGASNVEG